MNLRNITLRYMGWCPGIKAASKFFPDVEVPLTSRVLAAVIISFLGVTAAAYASYGQYRRIPEGPLEIRIGKGKDRYVMYDRDFNETFDYASLWGSNWPYREIVLFREGFNESEFAPEVLYINTSIETLDGVRRYMEEELKAPRVLAWMTVFLLNQSFEETYNLIWDTPPLSPTRGGFATHMGDFLSGGSLPPPHGVYYNVDRVRRRYSESGGRMRIEDGVSITKNSEDGWVWEIRIDASDFFLQEIHPLVILEPRYKVQLIRFPEGFEGFDTGIFIG